MHAIGILIAILVLAGVVFYLIKRSKASAASAGTNTAGSSSATDSTKPVNKV